MKAFLPASEQLRVHLFAELCLHMTLLWGEGGGWGGLES